MRTGVITSITQDWRGGDLIADAGSSDTVLELEDAGDFDEDPTATRWLIVGDETTPREYVAVDMDADTVTLAAAAGGTGFDAGDPVVVWDPTVGDSGDRVVEYVAAVELHDDSGTAPSIIPHDLIPSSGVFGLVGASVSIEEDDEDGEWYIDRVLGREPVQDGSYVDPDTLPDPEAPTDPPAESPAITAVGLTSSIILRAEPVEPTTEITYQMSTDYDPDSPGSATWADLPDTPTRSTIYATRTLPDGSTPLVPDTIYWFRSVASNVVGAAAPSAVVSGTLDLDAVSIAADEVVTGRLDSVLTVTGRIEVGAASWDDEEGLTIPQPDGREIRLPADGTAALVDAHLVGRSATFEDNTNLYGLTQLAGTMRLTDGITNPVVAPGVSRTWDATSLEEPALLLPEYAYGFTERVTSSTQWVVAFQFFGSEIRVFNKTTGALDPFVFPSFPDFYPYGITGIGSSYYLLGRDATRADRTFVYILNSSFAKTGEWEYTGGASAVRDPTIGTDGTYVVIAQCRVSDGKPVVRTFTTAGVATTSGITGAATVVCNEVLNAHLGGVYVGSADFGANRIIIAGRQATVRAYTVAGATASSNNWTRANSQQVRGLVRDSTGFHSVDAAGNVWDYTERPTDADVDSGYTWWDGDTDGGTHESMVSDTAEFTWPARSQLVVSLPPAPEIAVATGDDRANGHRVYVGPAGGTIRLQATPSVGVTQVTLTSLNTGSATPPGSNGFAALAATAGRMESTGKDGSGVPHTLLEGDGAARIAKLTQAGVANVGVSASSTGFVDVTFEVPFDTVPSVVGATESSSWFAAASGRTTTGFRLHVRHYENTSTTATLVTSWIATAVTA